MILERGQSFVPFYMDPTFIKRYRLPKGLLGYFNVQEKQGKLSIWLFIIQSSPSKP